MRANSRDSTLTLIALGVVAFILADIAHEAIGHGVATLAVGGKPVLLTSSYFSTSGPYSRWIPAGGGIANLIVGLTALASTRFTSRIAPSASYFVVLLAAFNLLFAAAYPFYSGIAMFGDWAAVIAGLTPIWMWRTALIVGSVVLYWVFLRLLAIAMRPFCKRSGLDRLRRMTLIPFWSALMVASVAGAFNPLGWTNILAAAAPAAASSFGFTQLDHFRAVLTPDPLSPSAEPIPSSSAWVMVAVIVTVIFVAFLGPGIHFH